MSLAPFENIWHANRDVTGVNVLSSTTSEYSALIISSSVILGDRTVVFAAVYGQFDDALIGGSANIPSANSVPDVTKQVVYYKGDAEGQAFFSNAQSPPPCASFTHCIYVFGVTDNTISIQGKTGVAYTISLADATKITMQDLVTPDMWCKAVPLVASTARTTDSSTTSNWIIGVIIGVAVLLLLMYLLGRKSKPTTHRKHEFASPLRALGHTPTRQRMRNREIMHTFD